MEIKLSSVHIPFGKRMLMMIMRTFIFLLCTTVFGFTTETSFSQEKVTIDQDKLVTVDQVFEIIKNQTDYKFMYPANLFEDAPKVQLKKGIIRVDKLINQSLKAKGFNVILSENNTIVIKKKKQTQQKQVTGKVTDENGAPLAGVTVQIKGTLRGVATNFDGQYTITVLDPANVIMYSYVGFATQEITVGTHTTINVIMKEEATQLDGITINAGYYNVSERDRTGSISRIEAKTIEKQPVNNPLAAMTGHLPGVDITQTSGLAGTGFNIEIRGRNSIAAGTEPLYIIDGVPYGSESLESQGVSGSLGIIPGGNISPLNAINPADIQSIEVLKDADATAIYGSRGANGVVLITTKKGKIGKTKVSVNVSSSLGKVTRFLDLMNTEQYIEMRLEAFENDERNVRSSSHDVNGVWDMTRYTDWQEELIGGTAYRNNAQVAFSGGNEQTQYLLSGAYQNETTVFPGDSEYEKVSVLGNLNHSSEDDRFKLNFSVNYVADDNNLIAEDLTRTATRLAPNAPALYDEDGNLNFEDNTFVNPLLILETDVRTRTYNLIANSVLSYQLFSNIVLKTN
ncbi:MAG: TonB-dependent receptor plug domain-containing protein, partial [Allomuricauda sp.]